MLLRDSTNNYRGGVRFEYNRWHVTLEQGGTTYKDDDQASFNGVNYGDRTTPLLGSTLVLNTLTQTYGIRGSSIYTQGPGDGQSFLVDEPVRPVSVQRCEARTRGTSTSPAAISRCSARCFSTAANTISAPAPPTRRTLLVNAGVEIRPFRRLRIIESFITNRYSSTGVGALTQQILLTPGTSLPGAGHGA